ncbi:MAG: PP2C family protein-serine/threonine phosphatase [Candidatus Rifleibacteriota bacterium]
MSIPLIFCGLAVIIQLILGLLVLFRDCRRSANLIFSIQLFLFTLWSIAEINLLVRGTNVDAVKLLMVPGILLSYFFCIFSAVFPEFQKDSIILKSRLNQFLFFLPAGFLLWLLWSDRLISEFSAIPHGFTISFGQYEFLAKGIIIAYLLFSLSTLSSSRKKAENKMQIRRLRYTFTAMLLPVAAGSLILAVGKVIIGGNSAYAFGVFPLLSIIMSLILGYTMLKYNLMEIDLMFSIGLVYTLLTAILAGVMELMQELMQELLKISDFWTKLVSVLLIAAFFSPLKELLIKLVNHFFGRQTFDSASVMQHILAEMRRCPDPEKMMQRLLQELKLVIDFSSGQVTLSDGVNVNYESENCHELCSSFDFGIVPGDINDIETAQDYMKSMNLPESAQKLGEFKEKGIRNFFRLATTTHNYGLMLLGAKTTRVPYTETEINLVDGICREIPFLLENLRMIERLISQDRSIQEIELARKMLRAISAEGERLELGNFSFARFSTLSEEIKGDLIDYRQGEQGFIGLYDAFHHGIQAVLTLNLIFAAFRTGDSPWAMLERANLVLLHFSEQQLNSAVTILRAAENNLEVFSAGNPSPLVITPGNATYLLGSTGQPLGLTEKADCFSGQFCPKRHELLLISTNGLFKAFQDIAGISLESFLKSESFANIEDCRDKIVARLGKQIYSGFSDDITFLVAGLK